MRLIAAEILKNFLKKIIARYSYPTKSSSFLKEQKSIEELLTQIIDRFEEWRIKYNNERVGYGIDPYYTSKKKDYPMAYAFYIRGFTEMYKYTGGILWLEKAIKAAKLLDTIRTKKLYAWGLPFSWKGRKEEPYLITSAFVGHAYLDLYEQTYDKNYLNIVENLLKWVVSELKFSEKNKGICFWFSPNDKREVLNPSAEIIAVMSRYLDLSLSSIGETNLFDLVKRGYAYIKSRQLPSKDWGYFGEVRNSHKRDFHVFYIVESNYYLAKNGIIQTYRISDEVVQPYVSIAHSLMNKNGSLNESDNAISEARLWGYGSFLYAGTLALEYANEGESEIILKYMYETLNYTLSNLYDPKKGAFYYKCNNHETGYIRHEAHIFYALTKLLDCTKFWKKCDQMREYYEYVNRFEN